MNYQEAQDKVKELAQGITNPEDVKEKIKALPIREKMEMLFPIYVSDYLDNTSEWAVHLLDYVDYNNLLNDYSTGTARREVLTGFLTTTAQLIKQSADHQARRELQAQNESTQFGMQLALAISDRADDLLNMVADLRILDSRYAAVLKGRKDDYHYTDVDGNGCPYSKKELREQDKYIKDSERQFREELKADRKVHSAAYWGEGELPPLQDDDDVVQCIMPLWEAGFLSIEEEEEEPALAGSRGVGFK